MILNPLLEVLRTGLEPLKSQFASRSEEELQLLTTGINTAVLVRGTECIHLPLNPMLFPEAYATILTEMDDSGKTYFDIDYSELSDCVGGGFAKIWESIFESQGYTVCDNDGNPCDTWETDIIKM